jgi:DNA-binding response OmpR family regulator
MSKHILVIDDEEAVRKSFILALKQKNYTVDTASNGKEGLDLFLQKDYDLIYLDLKMPVMSGAEVLSKIREQNKTVPIYIVTAFHQEFFDELQDARQQGTDFELLMKPIGIQQIRSITEGILEGKLILEGDE